jgi:hypothetical protein
MVQFYFLSVFLTISGGYALSFAMRSSSHHLLKNLDAIFLDPPVRLALGVLNLVTGAFKLISPMRGDVRIIGDLFPALAGILVGTVLLLELHRGPDTPFVDTTFVDAAAEGGAASATGSGSPETPKAASPVMASRKKRHRLEAFLLKSGAAIGFVAMLAGIMHFLFPMELFL